MCKKCSSTQTSRRTPAHGVQLRPEGRAASAGTTPVSGACPQHLNADWNVTPGDINPQAHFSKKPICKRNRA